VGQERICRNAGEVRYIAALAADGHLCQRCSTNICFSNGRAASGTPLRNKGLGVVVKQRILEQTARMFPRNVHSGRSGHENR
jgi:hypothetical protein